MWNEKYFNFKPKPMQTSLPQAQTNKLQPNMPNLMQKPKLKGFGGLLLTHQIVQVFDSNPYWILFVIINFLAYTGKRVIVVVAVVFFFMFWISWGNLYLTAKEDISTQLIVIGINSLFYLRDMYFLYKYKINIFCEDNKFDNIKFVSLLALVSDDVLWNISLT